jgi:hypothetical protein
MPSLNRFPLLGLWARECASRIGHADAEADVLGHAYAVLYAIRANSPIRPGKYKDQEAKAAADRVKEENPDVNEMTFGGDELQVSRTSRGDLVGRVGNAEPQTMQSYRYKVMRKFPEGYYEKVRSAMADFLEAYAPEKLDSKLIYQLYDQWKKGCAAGRMVDLDQLITWLKKRKPPVEAASGA